MDQTAFAANTFTNYRKLISLADHDWETAEAGKIAGLNVEIKSANRMLTNTDVRFITSVLRPIWVWIITLPCFRGP